MYIQKKRIEHEPNHAANNTRWIVTLRTHLLAALLDAGTIDSVVMPNVPIADNDGRGNPELTFFRIDPETYATELRERTECVDRVTIKLVRWDHGTKRVELYLGDGSPGVRKQRDAVNSDPALMDHAIRFPWAEHVEISDLHADPKLLDNTSAA